MAKDVKVDFVIANNGNGTGYCSTNLACPIFGYKQGGTLKETISVLEEDFPIHSHTYKDIKELGSNGRPFSESDKVFVNKVMTRLNKVCTSPIMKGKENVR